MIDVYLAELGVYDEINGAISDILSKLNAKLDELKKSVQDEAQAIIDEIEDMLEKLENLLANANGLSKDVLNKINDAIDAVKDALQVLRDVINGEYESILDMLDALAEAKDNLIAALLNLHDVLKAEAKDIYDQVVGRLNAVCDMLNCLIENKEIILKKIANWLLEELVKVLPAIDAKLYNFFYNNPDKVIAFFEVNGEFFAENYEYVLAVLGYVAKTYGPDALEWVVENPEETLEKFVGWYEKYGDRTWAMIVVYLNELGVIDAIENQIDSAIEALEKELDVLKCYLQTEIDPVVRDAINVLIKAGNAKLDELKTIAKENAKFIIAELKEDLQALAETVKKTACEEASAAVKRAMEALNAIDNAINNVLYNALHGDYTVSSNSLYVPMGDADYAEGLAALLGLNADQIGSDLTADADLITVDFGGTGTTDFVNAQLAGMLARVIKNDPTLSSLLAGNFGPMIEEVLSGYGIDLNAEVKELDWESLLDEESIRVKDELVSEIVASAVEDGRIEEVYTLDVGAMVQPIIDAEIGVPGLVTIDCVIEIPMAELAAELLDNVFYCYVAFVAGQATTLDQIREIAPDAEIVLLGMEADDEALTFGFGDFTMDFSENGDLLASFVNVHYFAYALVYGENVTFVAENSAEAIYASLNVSYEETGLWGDANGDGLVNTTDARLVLQYYTSAGSVAINTAVCDVDGKNGINTTDARLILQHYTSGGTMHFPVEE